MILFGIESSFGRTLRDAIEGFCSALKCFCRGFSLREVQLVLLSETLNGL